MNLKLIIIHFQEKYFSQCLPSRLGVILIVMNLKLIIIHFQEKFTIFFNFSKCNVIKEELTFLELIKNTYYKNTKFT